MVFGHVCVGDVGWRLGVFGENVEQTFCPLQRLIAIQFVPYAVVLAQQGAPLNTDIVNDRAGTRNNTASRRMSERSSLRDFGSDRGVSATYSKNATTDPFKAGGVGHSDRLLSHGWLLFVPGACASRRRQQSQTLAQESVPQASLW